MMYCTPAPRFCMIQNLHFRFDYGPKQKQTLMLHPGRQRVFKLNLPYRGYFIDLFRLSSSGWLGSKLFLSRDLTIHDWFTLEQSDFVYWKYNMLLTKCPSNLLVSRWSMLYAVSAHYFEQIISKRQKLWNTISFSCLFHFSLNCLHNTKYPHWQNTACLIKFQWKDSNCWWKYSYTSSTWKHLTII